MGTRDTTLYRLRSQTADDVCLVLGELSQFVLRVCCEIDDVVFGLGLVGPQAIVGFFPPFCVLPSLVPSIIHGL
jgi:hypothetical protein